MKDDSRNYIDANDVDISLWRSTKKTYICSSFVKNYEAAKKDGALTQITADLFLGNNTYLEIQASVKSIEQGYKQYGDYGKAAGLIESPEILKGKKITLANDWVSWYLGISHS